MNLEGAADLEVTYWRMEMEICLKIPTTFRAGERTTSLGYWTYMSVTLGRQKYTQLNY
jgi:hypothetical protein